MGIFWGVYRVYGLEGLGFGVLGEEFSLGNVGGVWDLNQ